MYTDSLFTHNRDSARKAGLTCWFYHFKGNNGAVNEANYFVKAVGKLNPNERLVLDDENEPTVNPTYISEFASQVKKLTGQDIVVYSNLARFSGVKLSHETWVASYGVNDGSPHAKPGVANLIMWQYTSKGNLAGISTDVDLNLYYGATPKPPTTDMITLNALNILYRFRLGRNADKGRIAKSVGKQTFDEVDKEILVSPEYKEFIAKYKAAKDVVDSPLATEIR